MAIDGSLSDVALADIGQLLAFQLGRGEATRVMILIPSVSAGMANDRDQSPSSSVMALVGITRCSSTYGPMVM